MQYGLPAALQATSISILLPVCFIGDAMGQGRAIGQRIPRPIGQRMIAAITATSGSRILNTVSSSASAGG